MDRSSPHESTPQIDFENTRDEDVDETSRKRYVDYSKRNFSDLSNILITIILTKINTIAVHMEL